MERASRSMVAGAIGGLSATALMSTVMLVARRAGLSGRLPPDKIAEESIEEVADRPASEDEERVVASVAHLGFGAAAGAAYGLATVPIRRAPGPVAVAAGVLFGTCVWLVSYQGWIPSLRILPPASRDHPGRVATMVVAHWVYGAALAVATRRLRRGSD